jgi:hypothetical protein
VDREHLEGYEMENEQTRVKVALGYTLNLGNFQSLRIDLGIDEDRREGESVSEAFDRVYSFVEQKLIEKINEAKTEVGE